MGKSLEASEAVALAKEESFEEIIRDLTQRLKDAETRASEGEKLTSTLAKDIETNEKELAAWMGKHAAIYRELETTYNEMSGYYKSARLSLNLSFPFVILSLFSEQRSPFASKFHSVVV